MLPSGLDKTVQLFKKFNLSDSFRFAVNSNGNVEVNYYTERYMFNLFTFVPDRSIVSAGGSFVAVFNSPAEVYSPLMYPVVCKGKQVYENDYSFHPSYSYNTQNVILEELFNKGLFLLGKADLSESFLSQLIALTCCKIFNIDENGWLEPIAVEGKVKFSTVQMLKYLLKTSDVSEIVDFWHMGVLPEQYEDFKENYQDAPKEWVEIIYGENVRKHWEGKPVEDLFSAVRVIRKNRKRF